MAIMQKYTFKCNKCKSEWFFIDAECGVGAGSVGVNARKANRSTGCRNCGYDVITLKSKTSAYGAKNPTDIQFVR